MRANVRSRPSNSSVSEICGLTVVPVAATRSGLSDLAKAKPALVGVRANRFIEACGRQSLRLARRAACPGGP